MRAGKCATSEILLPDRQSNTCLQQPRQNRIVDELYSTSMRVQVAFQLRVRIPFEIEISGIFQPRQSPKVPTN